MVEESKKNVKKIVIIICTILFLLGAGICFYLFYILKLSFTNIELVEYKEETNEIIVKVTGDSKSKFSCRASNSINNYEVEASDGSCMFTLPINEDYKISIFNIKNHSDEFFLTDYANNILKFDNHTIYLIKDEQEALSDTNIYIDKEKAYKEFKSEDDNIASYSDGVITGLSSGTTIISNEKSDVKIEVIVTDLLNKALYREKDKKNLTCNVYSQEENELLDKVLEYKINQAGYQTRGAVVAAARFLTLEFKYRIPYFYENGRLHPSGVNYADGEGRYYKKGLYLNSYKFDDITKTFRGPVIWGCPLTNYEDVPKYGYYRGNKMPNGLDCSGFVTWALKNAGYEPLDVGAGPDLTDLGEFVPINHDLLNSGRVKVGDLIYFWGHIAIIVGIDDEGNYYVAESLEYFYGVSVNKYSQDELIDTFTNITLMDEYYKEEGNYTNWI